MTPQELEQQIQRNEVVVVQFHADWCGPCKLLSPSLESACRKNKIKLIKLNIDDKNNVDIGVQFNIRSIPTVVRFENQKYTSTMKGFMGEEYVDKFVKGETADV